MEATRCLREEHQTILKVLDCFEIALRETEASGTLDLPTFRKFVEFFRGFADLCHHCKEEDRLFPVMVSAGVPKDGGPIGCMLEEHAQARELIRSMAERIEPAAGGDADALRIVLDHGEFYLQLLRNHIAKEDNVLFNMADGILDQAAVEGLTESYGEAETAPEYCERMTRCRALADEMTGRYARRSSAG
jgi:hemerythrin-like domain-containing protein